MKIFHRQKAFTSRAATFASTRGAKPTPGALAGLAKKNRRKADVFAREGARGVPRKLGQKPAKPLSAEGAAIGGAACLGILCSPCLLVATVFSSIFCCPCITTACCYADELLE